MTESLFRYTLISQQNTASPTVLTDAGTVTAEFAKAFAESEFEKYRIIQDRLFCSDFDRFNEGGLLPLDLED